MSDDRRRARSIADELAEALTTTPTLPRDSVATALARRYAEALDDCFDALSGDNAAEDEASAARTVLEISRLGARLEAMLDRLGMAPSARPAVPNGGGPGDPSVAARALDALERDAAAGAPASGVDYTAAVDPAVAEADTVD
jgi:hypothetical protein